MHRAMVASAPLNKIDYLEFTDNSNFVSYGFMDRMLNLKNTHTSMKKREAILLLVHA